MSGAGEPEVVEGLVDPGVASEFPELRLVHIEVPAGPRRSPSGLKERLRDLSDGFRGPQAVMMRQQPIPAAYRVFFRHIGLDPDVDRTPVEALALQRLQDGGFKSRNTLDDALTIATMETGVPLWALDADRVRPPLEIRPARGREQLGRIEEEYPRFAPDGRLVVADGDGPVAVLFGDLAAGCGVTKATRRMLLFSVMVAGVPSIHLEEALWLCADIVLEPGG